MNRIVFRQTARASARTVGMLAAGTALFYYLVLFSSSSFLTDAKGGGLFAHPPKAMTAFMNGSADFTSARGWLAAAMNHPLTIVLGVAAALSVAANAVATEVERGTMELVLTRPVRRTSFLAAKAAAALCAVTIVEAGGFAGVLVARATISRVGTLPVAGTLRAFGAGWLLLASLAMVGMLASTVTGLRGRAIGIAVAVTTAWYFVNFIALLIGAVSWAKLASPFHYFHPADAAAGTGSAVDLVALGGLAVVAFVSASLVFARRDLAR